MALHGSPGSYRDFKYKLPHLTRGGFRVLAPNWPGHGLTDRPSDVWHSTNMERVELLNDFFDSLGIRK